MDFSDDGCSMRMLSVLGVPAFNDNYLWLIHDGVHAAVVDPGDASAILAELDSHNLSLVAILLTHHHADHVGGVPGLLQQYPVPVFGPRNEPIEGLSQGLSEGDTAIIPELALELSVLDVPGHTSGHIAYVARSQGWLFCGDTLFAGGCGRLFEGTAEQMVSSLAKLTALPDAALVYCAHEYTLANLRFAQEAEPQNQELAERVVIEKARRAAGQPTVPSTIGLEKMTNPFLRYREAGIVEHLKSTGRLVGNDPIATFAALRNWKNDYR
jgi:hydroxyacylglutathione hydrolase